MERRIDFHGKLDGRTELGDGSVRFTARLTRTGVFDYGDHKELRVPEEVFDASAVDSFRGIALTEGHKAWVTPDNWRQVADGHVGDDVRRDGDFLVASVVVKNRAMLSKIDSGEFAELSMGYSVDLDRTPGKTDSGEEYHAIQRNIRGNHAALGPRDWGRAGPDVRLLDGTYALGMSTEKRIDAPASDDQLKSDLDAARAENDALRKERDKARKDADDQRSRGDKLEAERDDLKTKLDAARTDADPKKIDERVNARIALCTSARKVLGEGFVFDGKSDREVRCAVVAKLDPAAKLDGKSDDYVIARFDAAISTAVAETSALASTNVAVNNAQSTQPKSMLDSANEKFVEKNKALSQGGAPACAGFKRS